jgi:hypothetical protein
VSGDRKRASGAPQASTLYVTRRRRSPLHSPAAGAHLNPKAHLSTLPAAGGTRAKPAHDIPAAGGNPGEARSRYPRRRWHPGRSPLTISLEQRCNDDGRLLLARLNFILAVSSPPSRPSRLRRCSLRSQPRLRLRALLLGWLWLASRRDRISERSNHDAIPP